MGDGKLESKDQSDKGGKRDVFTEMSRDKALKKFLGGRRVVILTEFEDGSVGAENLSELLSEKDTRYLVDVPAAEDPDFSAAVSDMVRQDPEQTAETAASEGGVT